MTAHAYQQSVIETSKANPFVYTVQWRSAMEHNRTCLICEQRNGNIYPLDNVPLDHPNGLCTIFPVIQGSLKDVAGQLADWVNGNADERFDKKMDSYIDFLGFDPQKIRALTLAAGSLSRSVFSVGAGAAGNVRNDINNADLGLTDGGNGGIIEERFDSISDPMFEVTGSAEQSNPEEIQKMIDHINSTGAELERPEQEKLCYEPSLSKGRPGKVVISQNASYSAWLHEIKHLDDDMADGFLGFSVFMDPQKCAQREIDAYQIEIDMAKSLGRYDIAKRLETLRDNEIQKYK